VSGSSINLEEKLSRFTETWRPKVICELNDYEVKVAKLQGDFVWHQHDDTDELFLCLHGELLIEFRDRSVRLGTGDLFVVPKGVEHKPQAQQECHVLLIEPRGVVNTGGTDSELTAPQGDWV
jgi:mannose-6-phosphate isomerase-like protein (cupin superfamily)